MAYLFVRPHEHWRRNESDRQWLEKVGIFDAITKGSSDLWSLDPFDDICPLIIVIQEQETISLSSLMPSELEFYKTSPAEVEDSSDESEW